MRLTCAPCRYPAMTKTQGNFKLQVDEGEFTDSEIIVMLGENGTGKTTFIRMLAGMPQVLLSLRCVVVVEVPGNSTWLAQHSTRVCLRQPAVWTSHSCHSLPPPPHLVQAC